MTAIQRKKSVPKPKPDPSLDKTRKPITQRFNYVGPDGARDLTETIGQYVGWLPTDEYEKS
ncbi:MAG: hypothetical protein UR39_C0007G0008 [Candidatus Woesebacteria bacterium GW2011_GWA1_33_30]|uniref:Uncharacterized protein n=1 Tax=Candidatus Woesebacteria bacterium GW2011_GWA2_33_28 TaxID=1618561 RepID=A0A0G0C6L2_9BACT|nr:MAG: hypothetical protein UR38_C0007G0008 [Candidatus Woesebacteria bacterium GW2011_GWA2_33_28]KKP47790.1 MAG: hypothetical protein UR39_C0007G0008 [Candidatus Woesebacteria bacterium GW2011_GWA1_33_30]KKP49235.1 MAG: hypothetical protein UR40_C0008G0008 [Microgenomates group bacterium GW2011_GWC1_33_32]KKP51602.1 MAG: hypothetical protein UR44_C0008G0004 [Candidatus Woesebacteria bacterium GW2011_GWB1_33_38]KKP56144.1 MAG: hypothetical protein UR48_C0039G0003 [Microgenomates group bacteriu